MPSTINAQTTPFAAIVQTADNTGNLALQTANVTALTINSSQVVSLTNPLPAASGGTGSTTGITALNASNLTSGTVPDARFPATLPAASGVNLTNLNATNLASGTVPTARLGSGTANSTTFLRGDSTFATVQGGPNPLHGKQVFTSSGTFNVPTGVTTVKVTVIGAGGNGGTGINDNVSGGGGGAGGYIVDYVAVTSGGTASVTVGTNGGTRTSSFAGNTTLTADGGTNGSAQSFVSPISGISGVASLFGVAHYSVGVRRIDNSLSPGLPGSLLIKYTGSALDVNSPVGSLYGHGFGLAGNARNSSNNSYIPSGYGTGGGGGSSEPGFTGGAAGTNGLVIVEW